jgi:hypothetical protein
VSHYLYEWKHVGMRILAFIMALSLPACSEAIDSVPAQCVYSDAMIVSKVAKGGKIVQYDAKRMPAKQGRERTLSEHIRLANNDDISIVQSYCYVYRYDLKYRLSGEKKPTSLVEILPNLDHLISKSYAADYLTQPFSEIVLDSLTMQQKMLKMPFTQGLPDRYTSSSEFVGYFIDYNPIEKNKKYSAEFRVHIDVGGAD